MVSWADSAGIISCRTIDQSVQRHHEDFHIVLWRSTGLCTCISCISSLLKRSISFLDPIAPARALPTVSLQSSTLWWDSDDLQQPTAACLLGRTPRGGLVMNPLDSEGCHMAARSFREGSLLATAKSGISPTKSQRSVALSMVVLLVC